jgi:uncharacterized membrane protein
MGAAMSGDLWGLDRANLLAFAAMAVATYACRGGGYWLFSKIKPSPLLRAVLSYIPGTLFVSFVVPAVIKGGLQPAAGTLATLLVMITTRNLALSMAAGVALAWVVWAL